MKNDLSVIGLQTTKKVRIAASATRYEVGEPLHNVGTYTAGAISVNTFVLAAADTPVIGTHNFGGIAIKMALPLKTGTIVAHETIVSRPVAELGVIRGKAETAANVDTLAELLGILQDATLIDYAATGGTDGGELYTIKDAASANTSGLQIAGANLAKGTLDVNVDPRAYRNAVS